MFNLASKILFLFIDPPALVLIFLVCAGIMRKRRSRISTCLYAAAVGILVILGSPAISHWWVSSLENQYPDRGVTAEPNAQAIVLLGGSLNMPSDAHPSSGIVASSDRILEAMRLYRAGKAPLIVASGGDSPLSKSYGNTHEAEEMRAMLEEWGIPESAILVEDRSINTHENAMFTHQLLQARGINQIILVTSATHMPRAAATFRKVGFNVAPAPADFLTGWVRQAAIFDWLPASGALANSSVALREWIGFWVYRLRGWA